MPKTEEFLIETADRCTGLAREGRELVKRLEAIVQRPDGQGGRTRHRAPEDEKKTEGASDA